MTGGAYLVFIEIPDDKISIQIGKLGFLTFKNGFYCYIGSAIGKNSTSIKKRVFRHVKSAFLPSYAKNKPKKFWHIDYFLFDSRVFLKKIMLIPSKNKEECAIATQLSLLADSFIEKFGCSDCRCPSHLLYFSRVNKWFNSIE